MIATRGNGVTTPFFCLIFSLCIAVIGGIHGVAFTHEDHRGRKLFNVTSTSVAFRSHSKGEVILVENFKPALRDQLCGLSNGILLAKL